MGIKSFGERVVIYKDENMSVSLEDIEGGLFVHVAFDKFNRKIFNTFKEKWAELLINVYMLGYEEIFTYSKNTKFVNMVGGGEVVATYQDWSVIKWDLK